MSKAEIHKAIAGMDGKRSKYNVDQSAKGREARTYQHADGRVTIFASKHELEVYKNYVLQNVAVGLFSNVRLQVRFALHATTPNGFKVKVGNYIADFVATSREGKPVVMDAKGKATDMYRWKRAHFEAEYGLRILEL